MLPHSQVFEPDNYTLERIDKIFREQVKLRIGTQFTEEEVEWFFYILDRVAYPAHKNQYRDEGPEYIIHPLEVALEAIKHGENATVVGAALLHDVREDTCLQYLPKWKLQEIFKSQEVEYLTKLLSKIRYDKKITNKTYLHNLRQEPAAVRLKLYDRKVNLISFGRLVLSQPERVGRQIEQTRANIIPLGMEKYKDLAREIEILTDKLEERLDYALTKSAFDFEKIRQ